MEKQNSESLPGKAPGLIPPAHPQDWKKQLAGILESRPAIYATAALAGLFILRLAVNWYIHRPAKLVLPSVEVIHPQYRDLDHILTLPANVEDIKEATIYSHVSGYLKQIYVDEGDTVEKGQLMARIYAPDVMQQYNRDKSSYDFLEITRKRYQTLLKGQVISQQEYDQAKSQADEAKAKLDNDLANMAYTEIRAPFSGKVARRFKYPGDLIQRATSSTNQSPIFVLSNEDVVRVVIDVPEVDMSDVKIGDRVRITSDADPTLKIAAHITRIDPILDATTKTQRVLIDIPNKNHKLSAGMYVHVATYTRSVKHALSIPVTDMNQTGSKPAVYVLGKTDVVEKRDVELGIVTEQFAQITQGLSPEDQVVSGSDAASFLGLKVQVAEIEKASDEVKEGDKEKR